MNNNLVNIRVLISGGGTGGHIYPAVAIANEIKGRYQNAEILFVGADGRMEMEKVPKAGYKIIGLPIAGIQRSLSLKNLKVPFLLISSLLKARKIVKEFKPDIAVGVGGYASFPTMLMASLAGVPVLLQEQNSFAGLSNKILAKRAKRICVAYDGMGKYFPQDKIVLTGNPVRIDIVNLIGKREKAALHFGLDSNKTNVLVIGGSLGARTINQAVYDGLQNIDFEKCNLIWQTGKLFKDKAIEKVKDNKSVFCSDFIYEMDMVYALSDVVISRSGALSVSELSLVGLPTVFVPSPNVSEDHQTKNAMALVNKNAALLVKDSEANGVLISTLNDLIQDKNQKTKLSENIIQMAKPNATSEIVNEIEKILV